MSLINPIKYIPSAIGKLKIGAAYTFSLIRQIISKIIEIIKKHPIITLVIIFTIIFGVIIFYVYNMKIANDSRVVALESEISKLESQIAYVAGERELLAKKVSMLETNIKELRADNDTKIRESGRNEYKRVMSLKSAAIVDYYNDVYRPGVLQRNSARSGQDNHPDK